MNSGIVLYGPPAVGKTTIARELHHADARHVLYEPVKCGPGRTEGYRMVHPDELARIRAAAGDVLWERHRYGATYLTLRSELLRLAETGKPIVQLGQPEAVAAITTGVDELDWCVVDLRCPRPVAAARITTRETGDEAERLHVYDHTPRLVSPRLAIDTSVVSAADAAQRIAEVAR